MDIKYTFTDLNKKGMMYGIGSLLFYYADISLQVSEKMNDLSGNKQIRNKLTEYLRNKTGVVGITVDSMQTAIDTIMAKGDFFNFTVNGEKMCEFIKGDTIEIQVHMDETYFVTELAMRKFNPATRLRKRYPETIDGEKQRWMNWFEKEWKKDLKFKGFSNPNYKKTMMEE